MSPAQRQLAPHLNVKRGWERVYDILQAEAYLQGDLFDL